MKNVNFQSDLVELSVLFTGRTLSVEEKRFMQGLKTAPAVISEFLFATKHGEFGKQKGVHKVCLQLQLVGKAKVRRLNRQW